MVRSIDINADLGEGADNDEEVMSMISSCSIACGGHYGTPETISATIEMAKKYDVKIGAHPSYPDKVHFGRAPSALSDSVLEESLFQQLSLFKEVVESEGVCWHHVKPHGQLYHDVSQDSNKAKVLLSALERCNAPLIIYHPANSVLNEYRSIKIIKETFIDRGYDENGILLPRSEPYAVIKNPELAFDQLLNLMETAQPDTFCVHGDNMYSVQILKHILEQLHKYNIVLAK